MSNPPVIAPPVSFKPPVIAPPKSMVMVGAGKFRLGNGNPAMLGFEPVPTKNEKRGLFAIITGKAGTGKNSLAYSAVEEGPVLEIAIMERGTEGDAHMQQYTSRGVQRKIYVVDDKDPLNKIESERIWEDFRRTVFALYGFQGTIIINTIDEIYEIGRMAELGKLEKTMRRDYAAINRPMNELLSYFQKVDCVTNLILLSKGVDQWVNGENTGFTDYKGYPNALFMSDAMVVMTKEQPLAQPDDKRTTHLVPVPIEKRFKCTIMRAPADVKQEGQVLMGKDINFAEIKKRVLPT